MLAVVAASAALAASGRVVMEPDAAVGATTMWRQGKRCGAGGSVDALFMLKLAPAQAAELETTFWAVSTPGDARYGKHLTRDQLTELVGAPEAVLAKVHSWLKEGGVTGATTAVTRDSISAQVPCDVAERLFETEFRTFRHSARGVELVRASAPYSLPADIAEHVEMVTNMIALPRLEKAELVKVDAGADAFPPGSNCNGKCGSTFVTPAVLKEAYKLGDPPATPTKSKMGVAEFQIVMWDQGDLDTWGTACGVKASVDHMIGNNNGARCNIPGVGTEACAEALLDIQYIKAVAAPIPLTDIFNAQFDLQKWAQQVIGLSDAERPDVISVSYGNDEIQQTSKAFMNSCNTQFKKFGSVGVSVLFASGDQGVLGRSGAKGKVYHPDFPASSPYITGVGGTDFAKKSVIGEEVTWPQGGGGFSNQFGQPDYQVEAVKAYLSNSAADLPAAAKWNSTGRGYPDVAALGGQVNPYCIRAGGLFAGVAGTSASSPVVAGVFAKLNEIRLAAGKSVLGFLNPLIYKLAGQGFNDVTKGRNCGKKTCTSDGFLAVKGWDPATGWGTPNFEKLKSLV